MKDPDLEDFASHGLGFPFPPRREGYFTNEDARLYYAGFGQGTPLVLLHGGLGNSTNWAGQIQDLVGAGYEPIVMDTRGHGRSSAGPQAFSYRLFSRDVLALLDFLKIERTLVLGWSDGACTALELARTHPDRIAGVVFFACNVDPTGTRDFVMTPRIENCLVRHRKDFERMTPTLGKFEDLQPKLAPMQKDEPNYGAGDLAGITPPVAVVHGEDDEFIKKSHAAYLAAALPRSRLTLLEGAGHFAPVQDPDRFNAVLLPLLKDLSGGLLPHSAP